MATTNATLGTPQHALKTLNVSAMIWFIVAVTGQWLFAYYIFIFYGSSAIKGEWSVWSNRMARVPNKRVIWL